MPCVFPTSLNGYLFTIPSYFQTLHTVLVLSELDVALGMDPTIIDLIDQFCVTSNLTL